MTWLQVAAPTSFVYGMWAFAIVILQFVSLLV